MHPEISDILPPALTPPGTTLAPCVAPPASPPDVEPQEAPKLEFEVDPSENRADEEEEVVDVGAHVEDEHATDEELPELLQIPPGNGKQTWDRQKQPSRSILRSESSLFTSSRRAVWAPDIPDAELTARSQAWRAAHSKPRVRRPIAIGRHKNGQLRRVMYRDVMPYGTKYNRHAPIRTEFVSDGIWQQTKRVWAGHSNKEMCTKEARWEKAAWEAAHPEEEPGRLKWWLLGTVRRSLIRVRERKKDERRKAREERIRVCEKLNAGMDEPQKQADLGSDVASTDGTVKTKDIKQRTQDENTPPGSKRKRNADEEDVENGKRVKRRRVDAGSEEDTSEESRVALLGR